ncbi:hypothetical protein ACFWVB_02735 [Streptomyces microflavus]|uniref:hypothetical protein n=1 Tax=Streptomyces microflavus TaxID=1919 RepID=UPI003653700D
MSPRIWTDQSRAAKAAKASPGQWTLIRVYPSSTGAKATARAVHRAERMPAFKPAGAFEAYAAMCQTGTAVWVRYVAGLKGLEPLPAERRYQVCDRGTSSSYEGVRIVTVTVSPTCPVCGGPRGEARSHRFHEDGDWLSVDMWDNACGHVDMYGAALVEHRRREDDAHRAAVRKVAAGHAARTVLWADTRPVHLVAESRVKASADPAAFMGCMDRTVAAMRRGEDPATAAWTAEDPVKLAAEIEALAGVRRRAMTTRATASRRKGTK